MCEVKHNGSIYKIRGNDNNFGIIYKNGLDKDEAEKFIASKIELILNELDKSGSKTEKEIQNLVDKVAEFVECKFYDLVCRIDNNKKDIKSCIQENFFKIQNNQNLIQDWIMEISVAQRRQNELLEALIEKTDSAYYFAQKSFGLLLAQIKKSGGQRVDSNSESGFDEEIKIDFDIAKAALKDANFEDAKEGFKEISDRLNNNDVADKNKKAEAYFGLALAECKIQLIWDNLRGREQPVFHDTHLKNNLHNIGNEEQNEISNGNFDRAISLASGDLKTKLKNFKNDLDKIYTLFVYHIRNSKKYDCFICVKKGDLNDSNRNTEDFKWIEDCKLYDALRQNDLNPFYFDIDITEEQKRADTGIEYESLIAYALHTSKVFILVCSKQEYLETPWVKNEYTRFCEHLKSENIGTPENKIIIIQHNCDNHDIYLPNLPEWKIQNFKREQFESSNTKTASERGYWNLNDFAKIVRRRINGQHEDSVYHHNDKATQSKPNKHIPNEFERAWSPDTAVTSNDDIVSSQSNPHKDLITGIVLMLSAILGTIVLTLIAGLAYIGDLGALFALLYIGCCVLSGWGVVLLIRFIKQHKK